MVVRFLFPRTTTGSRRLRKMHPGGDARDLGMFTAPAITCECPDARRFWHALRGATISCMVTGGRSRGERPPATFLHPSGMFGSPSRRLIGDLRFRRISPCLSSAVRLVADLTIQLFNDSTHTALTRTLTRLASRCCATKLHFDKNLCENHP